MTIQTADAAAVPAAETEAVLPGRAGVIARLMRDRVAGTAAVVLGLIVLAAVFAPVVSPYDPYNTDLSKAMQAPSGEHWFGPTIPAGTCSAASSTARATP